MPNPVVSIFTDVNSFPAHNHPVRHIGHYSMFQRRNAVRGKWCVGSRRAEDRDWSPANCLEEGRITERARAEGVNSNSPSWVGAGVGAGSTLPPIQTDLETD